MKKQDQENMSMLYENMIVELNQSTVNSALLKHQDIKDKNPVSKSRAEDFSKRAERQGEKRGLKIRTTSDKDSKRTANYSHYYIEGAELDDNLIKITALMVDPYEDRKSKPAELTYDTNNNTLSVIEDVNSGYTKQLWLLSRTDAENLSKTIKKYTGMNVSWKNMDFIHSGDYSNQHSNTRYDMDKLGA